MFNGNLFANELRQFLL